MDRRMFVAGSASTIATILAGCSGGGNSSGPKGAVRQYLTAFGNENVEKVNSVLHPDGPASSRGGLSESYYDEFDTFKTNIESLTVAEEDETRAIVEAEYTITRGSDGDSRTSPYSQNIVLEKHDGNWRIYSFQ